MNQHDLDRLLVTFGKRVREIRKGRGMTLEQLAEKTGLSKRQIIRVELGEVNPKLSTICALAEGLGVEVAELITDSYHE